MRKFIKFIPIILGVIILLSSCSMMVDAKKTSDQFLNFVKEKNYDQAVSLIGKEGLSASPKEDWVQIFENTVSLMGDLKEFSFLNINSSSKNGRTETKVFYKLVYNEGTVFAKILLVRIADAEPFYVIGYNQSENKTDLE